MATLPDLAMLEIAGLASVEPEVLVTPEVNPLRTDFVILEDVVVLEDAELEVELELELGLGDALTLINGLENKFVEVGGIEGIEGIGEEVAAVGV